MPDAALFTREFECPSCGAPVPLARPGSRTLVCGYCGQTSHLNADSLQAVGEKNLLIDYGSVFQTGQQGKLGDRDFAVLGRMRFDYEDGFWDEWYLQFLDDGSEAWVQEDDGSFVLFQEQPRVEQPVDYDRIEVGRKVDLDETWTQVFITSKSHARVNGGEGELPFRIVPGEDATFVEGIWSGKIFSLELLAEGQIPFLGTLLKLDQIQLSPAFS